MVRVADALGRVVEVPTPPQRIVSLVPSLTETLFFWGLGQRVVGVTHFCVEPRDGVRHKARVGGTKNIDLPKLFALNPDLVIASAEENDRQQVEAIMAAGVPVFVTLPRSVEEAVEMLWTLGEVAGAREAARALVEECRAALKEVRARRRGRSVPLFCPIWREPWMTVGPGTYMHDLLEECGGQNIFGHRQGRYFAVSLEEVAARDPALVLLPSEPYRFRRRHIEELAQAGVRAAVEGRAYLVDGRLLCWYGPRLPQALHEMSRLILGP
jgi:ABC-type Fe3+-hydroxamate transport system substrate-binding protein